MFSLDFNFPPCSYSGTHVWRDLDGSIPAKHDKDLVHAQSLTGGGPRLSFTVTESLINLEMPENY